jgi:hypothetical protein
LDVAYGIEEPTGRTPASDVMLRITASPEARRCGTAVRTTFHVPITLTRRILSQIWAVAASRSSWGMTAVVPALLTTMSSRP